MPNFSRSLLRAVRLLAIAAALSLAVAASGCGGGDEAAEEAAPAETVPAETAPAATGPAETAAAEGECPLEGGVVEAFHTTDAGGVAGDIGPGIVRADEVAVDLVNAEGGILGCELVVDVVDEPFPDLDSCLRNYRDAISSQKYEIMFGPFNSACMAALPDLVSAAGLPMIANGAADHQPFFENFQPGNFQPFVTTFQEGRASAKLVADKGWKRVAILTPNYAYGQDVAKAFEDYFLQLVPDGEIVTRQFPEAGERNLVPFLQAVAASNPDVIFGGMFGPDVLTAWGQMDSIGMTTPTIFFVSVPAVLEELESPEDVPENAYGYNRGFWTHMLEEGGPRAKLLVDEYTKRFGDGDHPVPSTWLFGTDAGPQLVKALAEKTGTFEVDDWIAAVEEGGFTYENAWGEAIEVSPINHMSNNCATVGKIIWDEELDAPVKANYDPGDRQWVCLSDILTEEEAGELTKR